MLVSKDGTARLIVAAFENETNASLADYREQLLVENYAGANIDYSPVKEKWFVLSGTRGDMHFYERVSFTCGGSSSIAGRCSIRPASGAPMTAWWKRSRALTLRVRDARAPAIDVQQTRTGAMTSTPVFRFAPSPNGELHLGHAYSALFTASMAARRAGVFFCASRTSMSAVPRGVRGTDL